jgi:hypothetical protein
MKGLGRSESQSSKFNNSQSTKPQTRVINLDSSSHSSSSNPNSSSTQPNRKSLNLAYNLAQHKQQLVAQQCKQKQSKPPMAQQKVTSFSKYLNNPPSSQQPQLQQPQLKKK